MKQGGKIYLVRYFCGKLEDLLFTARSSKIYVSNAKVIYDEVIQAIKKRKSDIQFIFATHNANIPVLGDAEKVISASFSDDAIVINQGNIDMAETHQQIVDIMEGGQEAFDRRRMIHSAWGSQC